MLDIKYLVMDVDGTLTDGKVYVGTDGESFKTFDIKDGYGIKDILPHYGIKPIIITARTSGALAKRCEELGVKYLYQGCRNKFDKLKEIVELDSTANGLSSIAYIGDDILDKECMMNVSKAGGIAVCPNNAIEVIKNIADFICVNNGGNGAAREFIDWYIGYKEEKVLSIIKNISLEAYQYAKTFVPSKVLDGSYSLANGVYANVMTYTTKPIDFTYFEAHRKFIDVQFIIYGEELMAIDDICNLQNNICADYNEDKDIAMYDYCMGEIKHLKSGDVAVLYPNDVHRGAMVVSTPSQIRKIVFKVPVLD